MEVAVKKVTLQPGASLLKFSMSARNLELFALNPIYQLFQVVTRPVLHLMRLITPRLIMDKHLPFVAFFLLFWLWIILAVLKRHYCALQGLAC